MIYIAAIIIALVLIPFLVRVLYFSFGWFKWIEHDILKHCQPDFESTWLDPETNIYYGKCKYCGKEIQTNNQGEWIRRK